MMTSWFVFFYDDVVLSLDSSNDSQIAAAVTFLLEKVPAKVT